MTEGLYDVMLSEIRELRQERQSLSDRLLASDVDRSRLRGAVSRLRWFAILAATACLTVLGGLALVSG